MSDEPRLPAAYRLVTVPSGTDARAAAADLARAGTDDGTLVWAPPKAEAEGADTNLTFALALYPESDVSAASQLVYVLALGLADALGVVVSPGNEVFFEWPDKVLLNSGRVATITLDYPAPAEDGHLEWVILGSTVHIAGATSGTIVDTAVLRDEGWPEATATELLPHVARHFLLWVNRWLDDGFEPIRNAWLRRTVSVETDVEVPLSGSRVAGKFLDIDEDGRMVLRARNNRRCLIAISQTPLVTAIEPAPGAG
jgi:BirA family biotin operon repressor/biotin-[acetyl-CoA-carboxylase] ligase